MKHSYKGPGVTTRPNRLTLPAALGALIVIGGFMAWGPSAKAQGAPAKLQGSKVYLINQSVGTKVDAVVSLARDAGAQVYECNKMKLSKKATLKRDNADE